MPAAAQSLADQYGAKVASVAEIMKAKDVDAVLIGSPTGFHAEQIQLVKIVRRGDVGAVEIVTAISRDPAPPRNSSTSVSRQVARSTFSREQRRLSGNDYHLCRIFHSGLIHGS